MELRDLRALLAVVRSGSFTAAAADLGLHPVGGLPAGGRAGVRARPPAARTAPGAAHGRRGAAGRARRPDPPAGRCGPQRAGPPRPGAGGAHAWRCARWPGPAWSPPPCGSSASTSRRCGSRSARSTRRRRAAAVASGHADVALVDGITAPDNPLAFADAGLLQSIALVEVPVVVALPRGHPLQGRSSVDLDVLVDAPWIIAPALAGWVGDRAEAGRWRHLRRQRPADPARPHRRRARRRSPAGSVLRRRRRHRRRRAAATRPSSTAPRCSPVGPRRRGQRRLVDSLRARASLE